MTYYFTREYTPFSYYASYVVTMDEKSPLLPQTSSSQSSPNFVLVVHGGAGTMSRAKSTPEQQATYKAALAKALKTGYAVLKDGGEAIDAVTAAVTVLEDCPLFNAGKGAVFNTAGKNELESSIMLSRPPTSHPKVPHTRRGLGLTLLTTARNPIKLARALYLSPSTAPHTMLSGTFAADLVPDLPQVGPEYFFTEKRWREHRRGLGLPEDPLPYPPKEDELKDAPLDELPKGTVGAVALDVRGCLAAATSTGGRTNKLVGRIGDTPQVGSGFWAEEWKVKSWVKRKWRKIHKKPLHDGVAISGTGDGDYFIRQATASTIARRMQYNNESVFSATQHAVEDLKRDGGEGGVIAVNRLGHVAMPLNCPGMYRGVILPDGVAYTAIFNDDVLEPTEVA